MHRKNICFRLNHNKYHFLILKYIEIFVLHLTIFIFNLLSCAFRKHIIKIKGSNLYVTAYTVYVKTKHYCFHTREFGSYDHSHVLGKVLLRPFQNYKSFSILFLF